MSDPRVLRTELDGLVLLEPAVHADERGFFLETFSRSAWSAAGIDLDFLQHNHSRSNHGTLRGIHFQTEPGQAKLVRCARGRIFDVAVDMRPDSPTFGKWEGHFLDDENHHQFFVPVGFGHGFCVVSDVADVSYLVSSPYDPYAESGFRWDDPAVSIEWPLVSPLVSDRDREAPGFAEVTGSG